MKRTMRAGVDRGGHGRINRDRPLSAIEIPRRRRIRFPDTAAVLLMLILLFGQLVTLGANSALLSAFAACLEVAAAILVILLVRPDERVWLGLAPVLLPIALALIWASLPALFGGPDHLPMQGRPVPEAFPLEFAKLTGMFACLLAGVALGSRPGVTRRLFDLFVPFALGYVALTLVMRQIEPFTVFGYDKGLQRIRFTGTLLSANAAACIFAVIAIMTFGRAQLAWRQATAGAWRPGPSAVVAASGLAALMALGACALTRSRASLFLALIAIAIMLLRQHRRALFFGGIHRVTRRALAAALLAAFAVVFLLALPTLERFGTLSSDLSDRIFGMQHFLAMADRSPWFGYGLGSFATLNIATLNDSNVDILWNLGAAHNAPIQAALEAGWPFVLLTTAAIVIAIVKTVGARRMQTPDPLMMAQLLSVALIFACSLSDIALNVPAVCALAAFLSGTALGRVERATGLVRAWEPSGETAAT